MNFLSMNRWMQKLYWNNNAFKDSTNFEHIKTHYYWSHISVSTILHFCSPSMVLFISVTSGEPHTSGPSRPCSQR